MGDGAAAACDQTEGDKVLKKKLKRERQKAAKRQASEPQPASQPEPEPADATDVPGGVAAVHGDESDAAAEKKREANRKKRERAKAKKKAGQEGGASDVKIVARAERRDAGSGRGMGMFVTEAIKAGEPVVQARPALSVVFDAAATRVCGLCFASSAAASVKPCARCMRFGVCGECLSAGLSEWHEHECDAFCKLPAGAKKGDTSTLRMLLRYKATTNHGEWCGGQPESKGKEGLALLQTLQGDPASLPAQLLLQVSLTPSVCPVPRLVCMSRSDARVGIV
jgi:hypothetical protein